MTTETTQTQQTGIEQLRVAVKALNYCLESFLQRFTAHELLKIHKAWLSSDFITPPDEWTEEQIQEALSAP